MAHEVNALDIEQLNLKIEVQGHYISGGDATLHPTLSAPHDKVSGFVIH